MAANLTAISHGIEAKNAPRAVLVISQFGAGPFSLDARFAEADSKMW